MTYPLEGILDYVPSIKGPTKQVIFKERLFWTLLSLVIYFALSNTPLVGISSQSLAYFEQISIIFGAAMGTFAMLGIGPIVTASIIMQLLVGSGILNVDLNSFEGRAWFQNMQRFLSIIFAFLESTSLVLFGALKPEINTVWWVIFVITQVALGSIIILYLDDLISKWGIGSGVSLFILAGVSKVLFIRTFSPTKVGEGFVGVIPQIIYSVVNGITNVSVFISAYIIPLLTTLLIFVSVVYAQSLRVEIPLVMSSFRGFGRKWPLKFIYTSNMPVILASALLINLQLWGQMLSNKGIHVLGYFSANGQPIGGLVYYLTPPRSFIIDLFTSNVSFHEALRAISYTLYMIIFSVIFALFWVNTSGMDARSVANQIVNTGMQIPGFRRDPRVMEKVLQRYIPPLTVLGGGFVGLLAAVADLMGALTSGTGLLLAVMIAHNFYELIVQYNIEEMPSLLRRFMS